MPEPLTVIGKRNALQVAANERARDLSYAIAYEWPDDEVERAYRRLEDEITSPSEEESNDGR